MLKDIYRSMPQSTVHVLKVLFEESTEIELTIFEGLEWFSKVREDTLVEFSPLLGFLLSVIVYKFPYTFPKATTFSV